MKQSDLTSHVATQAALSKAKAHSPVDALFSAITEALAHDKSVVIPRFRHLHHQDARCPPGSQSAHRREHRHRGLQGAFIQGWQALRDAVRAGPEP